MSLSTLISPRIRQYAHISQARLAEEFQLSEGGYDELQVQKQREKYGGNRLVSAPDRGISGCVYRAFFNPFNTLLFLVFLFSLLVGSLQQHDLSCHLITTFLLLIMLVLSSGLQIIQELRTKHSIDQISHIAAASVTVRRTGVWRSVDAAELVVGDMIRLVAGDNVPADIRLVHAVDCSVSQSALSGEYALEAKYALNDASLSPDDYRNIMLMGSLLVSGSAQGVVLAVGHDTVYGDISSNARNRKNGFHRGAKSVTRVLLRFMCILIPVIFLLCGLTKGDWPLALLFSLAVAVGLVPEMLPFVVNACLLRGTRRMSRKHSVVKNLDAMQAFGSMDVLCMDKTGTLTSEQISLEYYMDILGNEEEQSLQYAYINSLYHSHSDNHLDNAILDCRNMADQKEKLTLLEKSYTKVDELPFDYRRHMSSVLLSGTSENILITKGEPSSVQRHCSFFRYHGKIYPLEQKDADSPSSIVNELLQDGMKVLAVAYKNCGTLSRCTGEEEKDLILLGYLAFFDRPKKSAGGALERLHALHVHTKVMTGDQLAVACSICHRLGMDTSATMTGTQLDRLNDDELTLCAERCRIFAELSPRQKARLVRILQDNGHSVGFLGDGMNDLPAVITADIGISVENAVSAVKENADVLLLEKDLNVLEQGILEGRKAFANMAKYIYITASSNFGNICSLVVASVTLPFLPMTALQIVVLNLLYDTLCLALQWDRVDHELYEKPCEWSGARLGRFMLFFGPLSSLFDLICFAFLFFVLCPEVCGGPFNALLPPEKELAFMTAFHSGWFLESMWTQVLILHLLRTPRLPFFHSTASKPVLLVTLAGIFFFTLLAFTPLGNYLGLSSLSGSYFFFLVGLVLLYMAVVTVAKIAYLRRQALFA